MKQMLWQTEKVLFHPSDKPRGIDHERKKYMENTQKTNLVSHRRTDSVRMRAVLLVPPTGRSKAGGGRRHRLKRTGAYTLRMQIGDLTDLHALEKLTILEELEIFTGPQAEELKLPPKLRSLKKCVLERAPLQDYVDALDADIWERTCREQKITTFRKTEG